MTSCDGERSDLSLTRAGESSDMFADGSPEKRGAMQSTGSFDALGREEDASARARGAITRAVDRAACRGRCAARV